MSKPYETLSLKETPRILSSKDVNLICDQCNREFTADFGECPYCKKKREDKERKEEETKKKLEEKERKRLEKLESRNQSQTQTEEVKESINITISTIEEPLKIATQLNELINKYYKGIEASIRSGLDNKQYLYLKAKRRSLLYTFIDNNCEKKFYLDNAEDVKRMKKFYYDDIKKFGELAIKGLSLLNISQLEFLLSNQYRQLYYDFEAEKFFEPSLSKGLIKYTIIGISAILSASSFIFEVYSYNNKKERVCD